jgi:hypothetical protein
MGALAFIWSFVMVSMSQTSLSGLRAGAAASYAGVAPSLHFSELGFASTLVLLSQFQHLMRHDGAPVDTQRMLADSHYAFEQLALAHTSTSQALRQCAMRVFAVFHA